MFTSLVNTLAKFGKTKFASRANFVLLFAVVLVLIAVLIYFARQWNSSRLIDEINFSGNQLIEESELHDLVSKGILNKCKDSILLEKVEAKINKHALVLNSSVSFSGISGIDIDISERVPKALVLTNKGNVYLTDTSGHLLPCIKLSSQSTLPVIRLKNSELKRSEISQRAVIVLEELSKDENRFLYSMLEYITIDRSGYILRFCDMSFKVMIGAAESIDEKIAKLSAFWKNKLIKQSVIDIDYIDLRWRDRIIIK